MIKTCYVCGFSTKINLMHCTACDAKLIEVDEEIYTCSDCAYFAGFNCVKYPAQKQITGPPQCSKFIHCPSPMGPQEQTMSLQDIDDLNNLDTHPDDSTFIKNVHDSHIQYYQKAAHNRGALIEIEYATKNGEPYIKHPIFAIFLIEGATKEAYLKEVRKQIKKNLPPSKHKGSLLDINYAKMEKEMIKKQGISEDNPYNIGEALTEEPDEDEYDDGWGDFDPYEEYKYDQGFCQNISNGDQAIWLQAAKNLNIKIKFGEDATSTDGKPLPDDLELYIIKEEDRGRTKELYAEVDKIRKQFELTKPSEPTEYSFAVPAPCDLDEVWKRIEQHIKAPIIEIHPAVKSGTAIQLTLTFRNPLNKTDQDFIQLLIYKIHKETKEKNPAIVAFGKSLKEGMENPDPVLAEISKNAENMPDPFAQAQDSLKVINEKIHGEYRFYWSKKPPKNVPFCIVMEQHLNKVLSVPVKNIHMYTLEDGTGCVDFKFVESLPPPDLAILKGNAKEWNLLEEPPTPKKKEKAYYLPDDMKASIQNMFSEEEIEKAQAWLDVELAKHKPKSHAAKSKMLLKILNKMGLGKKKLDDDLLEQSKDLSDDLFVLEGEEQVKTLPSSGGEEITQEEIEELKKQFLGSAKVPKKFFKPEKFKRFITISVEDASYYKTAAKSLKMHIRVSKAKTPFGSAAILCDVKIHKDEPSHRAGELVDLASKLKTGIVSDPSLKPILPNQMPIKKKCKKRNLKPGQRKVKFKKGPGK